MYGLVCGLVTKSIDKALYISNSLRSGTVWVNCFGAGCPQAPFGGFKVKQLKDTRLNLSLLSIHLFQISDLLM